MYLRAGSSKSSGHRGSGEAAGQDGVRACGTTSPPITIRRAGMSATRRVMTLPPCLPPDLRHMRSCATAGTAWSCRAPFGLEKPEAPSRQCARAQAAGPQSQLRQQVSDPWAGEVGTELFAIRGAVLAAMVPRIFFRTGARRCLFCRL